MKAGLVLSLLPMVVFMAGCAGKRPALGVTEGRLTPCPESPNCVNSQAQAGRHVIAPISYACTRQQARERLLLIIESTPRAKLLVKAEDYIRAEYTSRIFRFVDDVEFYFPDAPVIHVRSASRLGYSDLGANRRRVERIREKFSMAESE